MAKLTRAVNVDGKWYGPGHGNGEVPAEVAEKIDNPNVWEAGAELGPVNSNPSHLGPTDLDPDADPADPGPDQTGDQVPTGNVDDVLAWVGDDPDKADRALDAERAGKNRTTLVSSLESIAAGE